MRTHTAAAHPLLVAALTSIVYAGASAQSPPTGPTFEVVSIKRNVAGQLGSKVNQRPDGGFTMTNIPAGTLISRAYSQAPIDMVGLPGWAMSERYDVSATSSMSNATQDDRTAMLRAMLADRFRLAAHFEKREQPVFDLVPARSDGKLGSGLEPSANDCAAKVAADRAAAEAALNASTPPPPPQFPDLNAPPPPCTLRIVGSRPGAVTVGERMEGETTMAILAGALRMATGRFVVDKTGLPGSYRVTMTFDRMASMKGPDVVPAQDAAVPSVFTAIREQLGLKLESSRAERDTLVIDRFERPTEN
jgi:uncharacterized protein (TIGR03435 family)